MSATAFRGRFTQGDVKRAIAGAQAAGLSIARIEIDLAGKIIIIPGEPADRQRQLAPVFK